MGKSRSKPAVGAARIIKSLIAEGMIAKFQRRGSVSCTRALCTVCNVPAQVPGLPELSDAVGCVSVLGRCKRQGTWCCR